MKRSEQFRPVLRSIVVAIVFLSALGLALGAIAPPMDMSGRWEGAYKVRGDKGPDAKGSLQLDFSDCALHGGIKGTGQSLDGSVNFLIDADYARVGRRITGYMSVSGDVGPEVDLFRGKCSHSGHTMKLIIVAADGSKIKVRLRLIPPQSPVAP